MQKDCLYGDDEDSAKCGALLPEGSSCHFEKDTCGWTNSTDTDIYWKRHRGPTLTNHTGPNYDHTTANDKGFYMYMDASDGAQWNRALMRSPLYPPTRLDVNDPKSPYYRMCKLRFFYHMYGVHVYQLILHVQEVVRGCQNCGRTYSEIWVKNLYLGTSRKPANVWERAIVTLPEITRSFRLEFEAIRAIRPYGDIALDDISFSPECFSRGQLSCVYLTNRSVLFVEMGR
ncbi:hypothetical protein LSH36_849g01026 [Paralvinella palmiformis]|uniref:MAM domain-containing protein n=1 Tax=Paralvinella palmiformis TaxID=53620 RepID=A0AAD9IYT1_9ANNE|nr:hypothetical protein LSH36_849g01026 [Paralvinella palmiformis]